MDIKTLIAVATGKIPHNYRSGLCPDELQPDSRDPDCPACKVLIEAAAGHDAMGRRHADKIGHPAGDTPAVMRDAAAHIEDLERRLRDAVQQRDALLSALIEVRESLQFAADSPGGLGADTILMMHRPETLFDFMNAAIENQPARGNG